jgi:hypothetical protein
MRVMAAKRKLKGKARKTVKQVTCYLERNRQRRRYDEYLAAEGKPPFQFKTIPQGTATSVWAGVVAQADEVGGLYCENCHVGVIVPDDRKISAISEGVREYALDPERARALWAKSEELVGERF